MIERQFTDDRLAELYDVFYPPAERDDFAFYLPMVLAARSVLDVGCGTGALLRLAQDAGHSGRLSGLDPAVGMLNQARQRSDIEWIQGDLASVDWEQAFDLIVMTGHAFQELTGDDEIRTALAAVRTALVQGGRFAFETRNPLDRAWKRWPAEYSGEAIAADGAPVHCECRVDGPIVGGIVRSTGLYTSPAWDSPVESHGSLRFLDAETLAAVLDRAGLAVDLRYGDWDRRPLTDTSPEIITIAHRT